MQTTSISRRDLITTTAAATAVAAVALPAAVIAAPQGEKSPAFRYCLNTSTIRGQKLPIDQIVDLAAAAGYSCIEPWIGELEKFKEAGGKLSDLRKRIEDHGMTVESAIGFAQWVVDDDAARAKGLEQAKRDLGLIAEIGAVRMAAPPSGATKEPGLDLRKAAERYRALMDLGDQAGVVPMVEVWGFSQNLNRLSDAAFVAIASGHPKASVLPDIYHLYKGGSEAASLGLLSASCVQICHMNDYPDIPRDKINDSDRVYPGDGTGFVRETLQVLAARGGTTIMSLEVFNREYWKQDAAVVLQTGIAKMKAAVAAAAV